MPCRWPLAAMTVLLGTGSVHADTLTCAMFKDRLNGALLASAAETAEAFAFRPGFSDASHRTRYDWGDDAIGGALRCGPADEFEEFGITVRFKTKDTFADDINRFLTAQGASLCALASDSAPDCKDFGRAMLQATLIEMGRSATRGARAPSGLSNKTLFGQATAELTAAPTLVTFVLGAGPGGTLDAARGPLPRPTDKPPE